MQRIRVPAGILSGEQWRGLAELVRAHTPKTPLHLTTRQEIELHDVTPQQVPKVQKGIADLGLTSIGACGDTFRNITVCPCAGARKDSVKLLPAVKEITKLLRAIDGIYDLPRKFKIALACSHGCGQPWINDLGFVASKKDGRWGFFVAGAGSLGARPATGITLFEWLAPGDVLPLVSAAVHMFEEHGDRENRRRARFRHVRQRMGDEKFTAMLMNYFKKAKDGGGWGELPVPEARVDLPHRLVLNFANGDVSADATESLGELAERDDVCVRIANQHRVVLFGKSKQQLAGLAADGEDMSVDDRRPAVVACPGKDYCKIAIAHTRDAADRIRQALVGVDRPDMTVCISGCPNGCAHSRVADVGLTGRMVKRDGQKHEAFDVYTGGEMGRTPKLAELYSCGAAVEDLPKMIRTIVDRTDSQANNNDPHAD